MAIPVVNGYSVNGCIKPTLPNFGPSGKPLVECRGGRSEWDLLVVSPRKPWKLRDVKLWHQVEQWLSLVLCILHYQNVAYCFILLAHVCLDFWVWTVLLKRFYRMFFVQLNPQQSSGNTSTKTRKIDLYCDHECCSFQSHRRQKGQIP